MQFDALPESDDPSVELRPIERADLPVWLSYLQQPAVFQHTSWNNPTLEDLSKYVWSPAMREPSNLLRLAICSGATHQLIGTIGFHTVVPANRSAELAFDLMPSHWERGIATQACKLVVRWAHERAQLLRVQATTLESNVRSARVLERAGFEREGLLRCYRLVRGATGDFFMYSHIGWDAITP